MARVVVVTSEMTGRVNIACELVRTLTGAGHEAVVASFDHPGLVEITAHRGVRHLELARPTGTSASPANDNGNRLMRLAKRITNADRRSRAAAKAARSGAAEFVSSMQTLEPDTILLDVELAELVVAGLAGRLPIIGWTSMLSVWRQPGVPPLSSHTIPGRGWPGSRLGIATEWQLFLSKRRLLRLRQRITRAGEDRLSVLRALAEQGGASLTALFDLEQWLVPGLPRSVPVIHFNIRELEFPGAIPDDVHYLGPVLGPRPEESVDSDLQEVIDRRRDGTTSALIYCSFGAWDKNDDGTLLPKIIEAVRTRPDWELVVGLGSTAAPPASTLPSNVHVRGWAPQRAMLEAADVAITHAGISSVNECIAAEVPMLLFPYEFLDQPGNAARVERHGLGIRGSRTNAGPQDIAGWLESLTGSDIAQNISQMRQTLDSTRGRLLSELDALIHQVSSDS